VAVAELDADGVPGPVTVRGSGAASGGARLFPLYSVTKTVIATQVLQLAAAGELRLDEPVARFEPALVGAGAITVDHLLTHTSGLPDYGSVPEYRRAAAEPGSSPWPDDAYLALAAEQGLAYPTGQGWGYSNIGYLVLRRVVSAVRAQPWERAVREQVLQPAGLAGTVVLRDRDDLDRLVPPGVPGYHPGWVAHGLLASTAEEAARLVAACVADRTGVLLPPGGPRHGPLRRLGLPGRGLHPDPAYGRGLMGSAGPVRLGAEVVEVQGHSGGGPGYTAAAYVLRYADGRRSVVAALVAGDGEQPEDAESVVLRSVRR
jgi:D-alanyl-D-alanine carboxypeptidase